METKKTDNHYLGDKVQLRLDHSPWRDDRLIQVLDVFGGHGQVWKAIDRLDPGKFIRTAIDKREDLAEFHLHGDNYKVMAGLDLSRFDVIDLDAYGVPYQHLRLLFDTGYVGTVFVTFITTVQGRLPNGLLFDAGFTESQVKKAPTLCCKRGWDIFRQFLAENGVQRIAHRSKSRKHYLAFSLAAKDDARIAASDAMAANG